MREQHGLFTPLLIASYPLYRGMANLRGGAPVPGEQAMNHRRREPAQP